MDLWQLTIFCRLVELKSFSKAGQSVHLSQPTVSSHIKDLEDHFGCRLVDRLGKMAVPTKAGELLYGYAQRLLALRDETESALAEFLGNVKGRLVIGGSTIPGGYILPRIIGGFTRAHPDVTLALVIGDTEEVVGRVIDGAIEMGVVGAGSADKRLRQEVLLRDEMRLVVPPDHLFAQREAIDLPALFKEPFITREAGSGTLKSLQQSLMEKGYGLEDLTVVAEMGSTQAVCQAVKSGVGVGILSRIAVADELAAGTLKALAVEGLNLKRYFYLVRHAHRSESPLLKAFVAFLLQEAGRMESLHEHRDASV